MVLFPNAKINLGLHVLNKREDGFHEIDSVMVPIPLYDILEILPAEKFEFIQSGIVVDSSIESNLCVKAFRLMEEKYGISPIYMHLRKQIPMGAGLGGGSADAAFVIKGINELFELNLSTEIMEELAAQLGSDCAFFIQNCPQIAKGRGEVLTPFELNLSKYFLKIVNPGLHVGTKEAYAGIIFQNHENSVANVLQREMPLWKLSLVNDFEQSVFKIHPELQKIKTQLYKEGAIYAAMSGSGSTLFGIYEMEPKRTFGETNYLEVIESFNFTR